MADQTIFCGDRDEFMRIIAGLAERGIGFEAHAEGWRVVLTGSF